MSYDDNQAAKTLKPCTKCGKPFYMTGPICIGCRGVRLAGFGPKAVTGFSDDPAQRLVPRFVHLSEGNGYLPSEGPETQRSAGLSLPQPD